MENQPKSVWQTYAENTADKPPRPLLVEALPMVEGMEEALELGSGALNDAKYLLAQGFEHVTAVDRENLAEHIQIKLPKERFRYVVSTFDKYGFPAETFDLINAQYSLPFNPASSFEEVFAKLKKSLKRRGVFVGQLFGERDEWNTPTSEMPFLSMAQVRHYLSDMEILKLDEEEKDGATANGTEKHWHIFHIIARKL